MSATKSIRVTFEIPSGEGEDLDLAARGVADLLSFLVPGSRPGANRWSGVTPDRPSPEWVEQDLVVGGSSDSITVRAEWVD